jgi:hypothetical protein
MKRIRLRHNERRFRMAVNLTRREHEVRETARTPARWPSEAVA